MVSEWACLVGRGNGRGCCESSQEISTGTLEGDGWGELRGPKLLWAPEKIRHHHVRPPPAPLRRHPDVSEAGLGLHSPQQLLSVRAEAIGDPPVRRGLSLPGGLLEAGEG